MLFFLTPIVFANVGDIIWKVSVPFGTNFSYLRSASVDATGIYVYGAQPGTPAQQWRVERRSLTDGSQIWAYNYKSVNGGDDADAGASDGTYVYVAGNDRAVATTNSQWRIAKLDIATGTPIWVQTVNPSASSDSPTSVALDATGVYIGGVMSATDAMHSRERIEKRDFAGNVLWTQTTASQTTYDSIRSIAVDATGVYSFGYTENTSGTTSNWTLTKRNLSTGAIIWGKTYTHPYTTTVYNMGFRIEANGGYIYVAGIEATATSYQWRIDKLDGATGNPIWSQLESSSGTINDGYPAGISVDTNGVYVYGVDRSRNYIYEKRDLTTGAIVWEVTEPISGSTWSWANGSEVVGNYLYTAGYYNPTGGIFEKRTLLPPTNATCGTAATTYAYNATGFSGSYCATGADPSPLPTFPAAGNTISWTCTGLDLGTNASCSATRTAAPVGTCGTSARVYYQSEIAFSGTLCGVGTPLVTPTFPNPGTSVTWTCNAAGGNSPTCTASRGFDGNCGYSQGYYTQSANSLRGQYCAQGTLHAGENPLFPTIGGTTTWHCDGTSGGSQATCLALRALDGNCGTANKTYLNSATTFGTDTFCTSGTKNPTTLPPTLPFPTAGNSITWTCDGNNLGASPTCQAIHAALVINGSCGSANTTYLATDTNYGTDTFCTTGTKNPTTLPPALLFPTFGNTITWTCDSNTGGTNASCTARRAYPQLIANAGPDRDINATVTTTLDGNATGGDGNYTYNWTITINPTPTCTLTDTNTKNPSITCNQFTPARTNANQLATIHLDVNDGSGLTAHDDTNITIHYIVTLLANAGADKYINIDENTTLTGSASGGSGTYTYQWTWQETPPNTCTFTTPNQPTTQVQCNDGTNGTGIKTARLTVNDGFTTATDDANITVADLTCTTPLTFCRSTCNANETAQPQTCSTNGLLNTCCKNTTNPITSNDTNSIITFDATAIDTNALLTLQCTTNTQADINIYTITPQQKLTTTPTTIPCTTTPTTTSVKIAETLKSGTPLYTNATIKPYTTPCTICQMQAYLTTTFDKPTPVPDNNPLTLLLILTSILFIITHKKK